MDIETCLVRFDIDKLFNRRIIIMNSQTVSITEKINYTAPSLLTKSSKQDVKNMMDSIMSSSSKNIIVDMSKMENLDLWGAQQLVKTARKLKRKNTDISLLSRSDKSTSLLLMLRINLIMNIMTIHSNVAGMPNQKWAS